MQHKPGPHMLFHISRANKWLNYKEVRWSKNNKIKKLNIAVSVTRERLSQKNQVTHQPSKICFLMNFGF